MVAGVKDGPCVPTGGTDGPALSHRTWFEIGNEWNLPEAGCSGDEQDRFRETGIHASWKEMVAPAQ